MELWEIAAALGMHRDDVPQDGQRPPVRSRRDLVAERMRHARGEGPKPEPDDPGPAAMQLAQAFARR